MAKPKDVIRLIKKTRQQFSADEKFRIVLKDLRPERRDSGRRVN